VSTAVVSPSTVKLGGKHSITVSVTSAKKATALVDIEIYGPDGGPVTQVFQKYYDNVPFRAGTAKTLKASWTVPSNATPGTYTVHVGIFSPGWGELYDWNDNARTFTITR
jgi:hypothetical protein